MTTLVMKFREDSDDNPPIFHTVTIEREGDSLTREQVINAFEDLLRGAGYECEHETLQIITAP